MKAYILGIALMLTAACNSFEPFTFVQMSDTQIGFIDKSERYSHSDSLMKAAVAKAQIISMMGNGLAQDIIIFGAV